MCLQALDGVGDESRGSIPDERMQVSLVVRRRLSEVEEAIIGSACDIRGTNEAEERLTRAWRWMPPALREFARAEMKIPVGVPV
mgnify:CR=1 FL=1